MAKVNALVNAFTAGEVSPRMNGRVDTTKYRTGLRTCHNFVVMPHGGVRKRGGTRFVAPVKDGATKARPVPFQFNTSQTYMLEVGYASAGYIRIFTNGGILTDTATTITGITKANPGVVTAASHGLSNGDWVVITGVAGMTQVNNRHFQVAGATTNTFQLSGVNTSGYDTYTSAGSVAKIIEIATDYTEDEIDDLSFAQSADTLYIAHEAHALAKLERTSATVWTISDVEIENGPFRKINTDKDNTIAVTVPAASRNISAATQADPCVITTSVAHGYTDGATVTFDSVGGMVELNGNKYEIRVVDSTSFYLTDAAGVPIDSTAFTAYTSGGTVEQVVTRWGTISNGAQVTLTAYKSGTFNADMVGALWRIWEPGKGTGVAQPYDASSVTNTSQYTKDGKVYGVINLVGTQWQKEWQYPTHEEGVVHVQNDDDTKSMDAVYLHDGNCTLEITAYNSSSSVTAVVVRNHVPKSVVDAKSAYWEEGAWSTYRGFPRIVAFHEQRLWVAGNTAEPQTIWASRAGVFEDFLDGADDDRSVIYKIASDRVEAPVWFLPGKILTMGTASGEYSITAGNRDEALTPSNARITRQTTWGSAPAQALRVGSSAIFIQRDGEPTNGGRRMREFGYVFESDAFQASDMTILSEHLGQSRFKRLAYTQDPDPIVWVLRENGTLVGLSYEKDQQVLAWHRHTVAGSDVVVDDFGVIPGADGDELWLIVERSIDGVDKMYLEIMTTQNIGDTDKADFTLLDCHLSYDGAATTTITGLWHLEGETVQVLADGAVQDDVTVADGKITLTRSASTVHVGYNYTATLETMDLEAGAVQGTAHGRVKRISEAMLQVYRSMGGKMGYDADSMDWIPTRTSADAMDASVSLYSGFRRVEFPKGYEYESYVRVEQTQPLPLNVLGVTVEMNVSG